MVNSPYKNDSGFTLVEVLISVVLLLILIGPLFSFLKVGQANRSVTIRTTDIEQNARAAMITMGRDITNAGFNFAPTFDLGSVSTLNNVLGATNDLVPLIPGNDVNRVRVGVDASNNPIFNITDQITLLYVDQTFNNGLPLTGNYSITGGNTAQFTVGSGSITNPNLFVGDLLFLNRGTQFAIATVSNISGNVITFNTSNDLLQLNQFGATDPLTLLNIPNPLNLPVQPPLLVYRFLFVTFYVDVDGNLIRREKLAPPHTTIGDGGTAIPIPGMVTPDQRTYTCNGTCYYDNIIATGVEDLQFTYNLNGNQPVLSPTPDPGFRGVNAPVSNLGTAPVFRLNDIREVNVSVKVRAADRDTQVRDQNFPTAKKGYVYRFSLNGTFGVRNLYPTNFQPDLSAVGP